MISRRFQANRHEYPLANMRAFMEEFRKFTGWDEHFPNAIAASDWIEFLRIFKELSVSPEDSENPPARLGSADAVVVALVFGLPRIRSWSA